MRRGPSPAWLAVLLLLLLGPPALAQKAPEERRLLRIESRVYGWYGVAEPAFDRTIGRRQLYKINAGEQFLAGLDGRLVILQGKFSEGQLDLGELAPPPISVPEGSLRQRFLVDRSKSVAGLLTTVEGYRVRSNDPVLATPGPGWLELDAVVRPISAGEFEQVAVLAVSDAADPASTAQAADHPSSPAALATATAGATAGLAPAAIPANLPALPGGALLELEMTQGFVDQLVDLGRSQAGLKASFQAFTLEASQLRVILPEGSAAAEAPWRLEGTVEFSMAGTGSLAESSFVISARPLIEGNVLSLEPNWDEIKLEGQLPFAFVLDASLLQQLMSYLPKRVPVLNLDWISSYLRSQGLLAAEEQVDWFLAPSGPGTLRLGLGPRGASFAQGARALAPGNFRLQLAAPVADRLVRRGVQSFLNPDQPFVPNPPIPVGQVLFVSIKVEKVFLRSLQSGYSNGVFRFKDLVVDVAWRAGPLSGVEPLLSATGFIRPRLTPPDSGGVRYWDWDTVIESLTIRSTKMPGDKEKLARELIPRLEKELGSEMAQKQHLPARLPLDALLQNPATANAYVELTDLRPLDAMLELEGRLVR
jgi:hypothetical protein